MGKPRNRIVCVHALNSRTLCVRLDKGDRFVMSANPVVAIIGGQRYEVRETRKEIESFIQEA